jgi:hypothetical protein
MLRLFCQNLPSTANKREEQENKYVEQLKIYDERVIMIREFVKWLIK